MTRSAFLAFVLLLIAPSITLAGSRTISSLYDSAGIEGTLLIESLDGDARFRHNPSREGQGYIPASTFKIPNTLIALEEGVVRDQYETIEWDGIERAYAPWNSDQNLATAFAHSCVWCYQRFAAQIGHDNYKRYLSKFEYGNQKTGKDIETFWLDGELRVSVRDQVEFLRKVYLEELPVKRENFATLKDVMLARETPVYKLWAKTGWKGEHGWYVGYIKTGDEVWLFANHIEVRTESDLALRESLTLDALRLTGIIPE